ncbi:MAG: hypothetical protein ACYC7E_16005 [Armatimonadota bacterium]
MATDTVKIERVVGGGFFPRYTGEDPAEYWRKVEAHAERLHRCGVTHVGINDAVVSIPLVMDPENSYLRFQTYAHPMDRYVTSTYNVGIYHESALEENRKLLLWQAKLAKQFGFRCMVWVIEMTFQPESFFRRHPDLRGPRVDNPACSHTPLFGLCPEVPEVQDHYRQLTTNFLTLAPEVDEVHIFANDSGGGFCYSDHLYAGPNGPSHCRKIPTGKQAQTFCRTLLDAGRKINPDFRVVMTSSLSQGEVADLIDGAPEGVTALVYGAFAWMGGLEDRWANQAVGPAIHQPEVRAQARAWQDADMKARIDMVTSQGLSAYAWYSPGYYSGPSDAPCPYQTHEIMMKYLRWGVRNISGGSAGSAYHANTGIFVQALHDGIDDTPAAVRKLAVSWVGEALADDLCEVWRLSETADRECPKPSGFGHSYTGDPLFINHPLIPDAEALGEHDLDYYLTPIIRDEQAMKTHQGGIFRVLHFNDEIKRYIVRQLEEVVLPANDRALALLDAMLAAELSAGVRECLETQRKEIGIARCNMTRVRNWFQAAFHLSAGSEPYAGIPSLPEIIQAEIDNSRQWHAYETGESDFDSPRQRLMIAHQNDPPRRVDLRDFPYHEYPGLEGWTRHAAHLREK